MLTLLPNGWIVDDQARSNLWTFILKKKCPELLLQICNHMAEPENKSGIYKNKS